MKMLVVLRVIFESITIIAREIPSTERITRYTLEAQRRTVGVDDGRHAQHLVLAVIDDRVDGRVSDDR
jgi:hypothetical protein